MGLFVTWEGKKVILAKLKAEVLYAKARIDAEVAGRYTPSRTSSTR
jgi:hypothetical protein